MCSRACRPPSLCARPWSTATSGGSRGPISSGRSSAWLTMALTRGCSLSATSQWCLPGRSSGSVCIGSCASTGLSSSLRRGRGAATIRRWRGTRSAAWGGAGRTMCAFCTTRWFRASTPRSLSRGGTTASPTSAESTAPSSTSASSPSTSPRASASTIRLTWAPPASWCGSCRPPRTTGGRGACRGPRVRGRRRQRLGSPC
mmetsp:Transcript_43175/g.105627  ORF Transcript_43175/g.105627 Transcript_43175/m.105627 type:complete len:201 (+) Transcript_43175:284-886(+)